MYDKLETETLSIKGAENAYGHRDASFEVGSNT